MTIDEEARRQLKSNIERIDNTLYTDKEFDKILSKSKKYKTLLTEIKNELLETTDTYGKISSEIRKIEDLLKKGRTKSNEWNDVNNKILGTFKSISSINNTLLSNTDALLTGDLELKKVKSDINKLSGIQISLTSQRDEIQNVVLKGISDERAELDLSLDADKKRNTQLRLQEHQYRKIIKAIDDERAGLTLAETTLRNQKEQVKSISDQMGIFGKLMSSLKNFPGLSSIVDLEVVEDSMQSFIVSERGAASWLGVLGRGASTFGTELAAAFGPATALFIVVEGIVGLFRAFMASDDRITRIQRSFSMNVKDATKLRNINTQIANESKLTYEQIQTSREKVNELTGLSIVLNNRNIEQFGLMSENLKLSEESLAGLLSNSFLLNGSVENTIDNILGTSELLQHQSKLYLDDKKVLETVLKTSGGIRANFKGNVTELTKSVTQAQSLGVTLEQISSFGEKLLDFESSISSELQAELITGKQLNLERARYYALTGDTNSLMKEMLANTGDIDEFTKMNVIQQKSLAEAFGMSRDELSDMLFRTKQLASMNRANYSERAKKEFIEGKSIEKQIEQLKLLGKTNDEIVTALGKGVRGNLEQLRIDEEFAKRVDDLKSSFLSNFGIETIRSFFAVLNRGMIFINKLVAVKDNIGLGMESATEMANRATNRMSLSGLIYNTIHPVNDSVISPKGRIQISTPEGMITPNIKDSIITTTNPQALLNGGGTDVRKELQQLTQEVKRGNDMITSAINQNKNIYINSTKLTETINKYNNKLT